MTELDLKAEESTTTYQFSAEDRRELRARLREVFAHHCLAPYCRTCQNEFDKALAQFRQPEKGERPAEAGL